jgi:tetratricopeptide (TPR) repeat protein
MNLRPKTMKRLTILLTAGAAVIAAASLVVCLQLARYEKHRLLYRAQGMSAFSHHDYRTASTDLSKYLSNDRVDADAIYALAVCRTNLPRPDLGHLLDAKKLFVRYLELRPDDLDAQHELLEIYQKLGYPAETMTIADGLLQKNPDDVAALLAKLGQLNRGLKFSDALSISMRLNDLTPLDLRTQILTLELMSELRRSKADILTRANSLLSAHPNDPRFQLLRAVAAYFTNDLDGTKHWLQIAAAGSPPDADFVLLLTDVFDKLSMWDDARSFLEKAASESNAPTEVKATLAQRLFELDQYDAALHVLQGVNPTDPGADSRLLGLTGLLLFNRNHPTSDHPDKKLNQIVQTLRDRDGDLIATAWCSLLQVFIADPQSDPLQPIRWCQTASRLDPDNADARFYLGMGYQQLGESELALQLFRQTIQMQPEWAMPYAMAARILLDRNQSVDAAVNAQQACDRDPHSLAAQKIRTLASYKMLHPTATAGDIAPLLSSIRQIRDLDPNDPQLLAAEIDLLARSNQRNEAVNLARSSLSSSAISPATLCSLEAIDHSDRLGNTALITAKAAQCASDTPESALSQVQIFAIAGQPDLGRHLLPMMETHRTIDWRIAWLQAREILGDSDIDPAWEHFADSLPHNFDVQRAALHSPAVISDRTLMDRTIDRYKSLTGEDSLEWRFARARWQLASTDDAKNNATAVAAAMAEVVRTAPQYVLPQVLWADALEKLGDTSGAIAHLQLASNINPADPDVGLKLAAVLMDQGRTEDVLGLLNGIVNGSQLSDAQRVSAARLYRIAGEPEQAVALLKDDQVIHTDDPARDLLLAKLLAERGDPAAAAAIYNALIQQQQLTSPVVLAAAWFAAAQGQIAHARECLLRLNNLTMPAGEREIALGQFESAFGTAAAAAAQFQAAAKIARHSPRPWLEWAGLGLRTQRFAEAIQRTESGLKNNPGTSSLKAMLVRARTLEGLKIDAQMQPLIDSLAEDPASDAGTATLAAIADAQTAHESTEALSDRLATVVNQYPRYLPALIMLVSRDYNAGRYDRAAKFAQRACDLMPLEAEPTHLLSLVLSKSGRWNAALSAAIHWRNRTLDHPQPAVLAIATAELELNHPNDAIEQLSAYLPPAISQAATGGDTSTPGTTTVELYLRALCQADRAEQAWTLAEPLVKQSDTWRHRWLRIVPDSAHSLVAGAQQLRQVEPLLSPTSVEDQLARGEAWYSLGSRFDDSDAMQNALAVVEPLTDGSPTPADAWLLLGEIHQQLEELPEAETAFTKAVAADPSSPPLPPIL